MDVPARSEGYITIKDHKDNFVTNTKTRLINPNKCETGKVSKSILQRINAQIRSKTNLKQWRSTQDVIKWFRQIDPKRKPRFLQFDIVDFYPSINSNLLSKALDFAQLHSDLTQQEREIIMVAKRTLLWIKNEPWIESKNDDMT